MSLAGLSLVLLLPLVQALSPDSPFSFWQAARTQAGLYKTGIQFAHGQFLKYNREAGLLLALTSLLPVLVMSIRWRTFSTDDRSAFGLGVVIFLISHTGLLLVCLWVAFDPFFGPLQISRKMGFPLSFLSLYYLSALSIGYYSGFFLLIFKAKPGQRQPRRWSPQRLLRGAVPKMVYLLTALALVGLLHKNLPVIQRMNRPQLRQYGKLAAQSLPPEGGIVFSDEPFRLRVLQAALASEGRSGLYVPVEMQSLPSPLYQKIPPPEISPPVARTDCSNRHALFLPGSTPNQRDRIPAGAGSTCGPPGADKPPLLPAPELRRALRALLSGAAWPAV